MEQNVDLTGVQRLLICGLILLKVCDETVVKPKESKEHMRSARRLTGS